MSTETIFFSYSRNNTEFVLRLANDLRHAGADIWLDQLDIRPGTRWDSSIEKALKSSKSLLVILSNTAVASHNVMDEVSYALEKNKNVVPVLLEECEIPFRLKRLQYADFTSDYKKGLKTLAQALHLDQVTTEKLAEVGEKSSPTSNFDVTKEVAKTVIPQPNIEKPAATDLKEEEKTPEKKPEKIAVQQKKKPLAENDFSTAPAPKSKTVWFVGAGVLLLLALLYFSGVFESQNQIQYTDETDEYITSEAADRQTQETETDNLSQEQPSQNAVDETTTNNSSPHSEQESQTTLNTTQADRQTHENTVPDNPSQVNGENVNFVQYTNGSVDPSGYFRQISDTKWEEESIIDNHITPFEEYDRDEWTVHLVDRSRDMTIHLDLEHRQVVINMYKADRGVLYTISDAKSLQ